MGRTVDTPIGTVTADHFHPGGTRHQLFLGPKFLYTLFDPDDRMHPVSRSLLEFVRDGELPYRRLVVNEHIVDDAATRLKKRASTRHAVTFLTTLDESDLYRHEPVPGTVFDETKTRFVEWTDLDASFTDFLVATHMEEVEIDHVATFDQHYDAFDVTTLPYRR